MEALLAGVVSVAGFGSLSVLGRVATTVAGFVALHAWTCASHRCNVYCTSMLMYCYFYFYFVHTSIRAHSLERESRSLAEQSFFPWIIAG